MTLLLLFYEFFKVGLFAIGGGLAAMFAQTERSIRNCGVTIPV